MGPTVPTLLNVAYRNQSYPSNTPTFTATTAWWEAQRALSDQDFICPAFYTSTYLSASAGLDVYQYMFSGSATVAIPTAVHCSNMAYQFQQLPESASQEEWDLAHAIGSYIFNFAATGNPNTAPSPTLLHNGNVDGKTAGYPSSESSFAGSISALLSFMFVLVSHHTSEMPSLLLVSLC